MVMNEKLPNQVQEFSAENCPNGSLAKVAKFHTNSYHFVVHTNSRFWVMIEELPMYHFPPPNTSICGKDSNLVDLSSFHFKEMSGHPDAVPHSFRMPYISLLILTFSNRSISVKASLINTKRGNLVNLAVLFLTMWINTC